MGGTPGFIDLLLQSARSRPEALYARFDGEALTYAQLERGSAALAVHLQKQGLEPGARVAVMMQNSIPAIMVIFALARAGFVWVPVNARQRGEGLHYLLTHSTPSLIIADADFADIVGQALDAAAVPLLLHGDGGELADILSGDDGFAGPTPSADAPFAIMYTSGTTGRPKGAIVTHHMLRLAAEAVALLTEAGADDAFFVWEPLFHIGGAQLLPLPMMKGMRLAFVRSFSASRFWDQVIAEDATHIHHLGGVIQLLLKQPVSEKDRAHRVRMSWGGGAPRAQWRQFEDRFGLQIRECYGMTEASSITTCNLDGTLGSVGRPAPWFRVLILDATGAPVPTGERGEIVVETSDSGAFLPGYWENPQATAAALRGGRLHTGDLGSVDAAGDLYFHGRMSDSLRCKGENVSAWEVEHVVASHPDIEDCAVIGVDSDIGEQDIKLFVKPRANRAFDPQALSQWLAPRLASYQQPRFIALVEEFSRTPSQRIMKHRLSPALDGCWRMF